MKVCLEDQKIIIYPEFPNEEKLISDRFTYEDSSLAYMGGSFNANRIFKKSFLKTKGKLKYLFSGFLKEFLLCIKENNIKITEIIDKRSKFDHLKIDFSDEEIKKFLPQFNYIEHQVKSIKHLLKTSYGIIEAPTSSGKSETMIAFIKLTKLPTLILVNRISLAIQLKDRLAKNGLKAGISYGKEMTNGDVVVSTIGSVKKIPDLHKFKVLIVDECFHPETKIITESGKKTIANIVNNKLQDNVYCYNALRNKIELKKIVSWYKKEVENILMIEGDRFKIKVTENHPIYVNNFLKKRADELVIGDKIIAKPRYINGNGISASISEKQYKIILGMILGDANLSKTKNLARLGLTQGEKQFEYLKYKISLLSNLIYSEPRKGISGYNILKNVFQVRTQSSIDFKELYDKIYINNKKSILNIINEIDWSSLAFWIMDDGSLQQHNNGYCNYLIHTNSFTEMENNVIIDSLNKNFGIKSSLKFDKSSETFYLYIKTESTDLIAENICKYFPISMQYKLPEKFKNKFNFNVDDKKEYGFVYVKKISSKKYKGPVYNIEVEDNHNYFVNSGFLVGNCHRAQGAQFQEFLTKTAYPIRFGFSATPNAGDPYRWAKIRQFFGDILYRIEPQELIENKVIALPKIEFIDISCPPTIDWPTANIACLVENRERNNKIKELIELHSLPTLVLINNIEHGNLLSKEIGNSIFLSGIDDPMYRKEIIAQFEEGEIDVIISSKIFNEGISINSIKLLIIAGGGKSKVETIQRLGRGLRVMEGKEDVLVYDFTDSGNYFTERHSKLRKRIYKKTGFEVL